MRFLGGKLRKVKDSWAKQEVEVREMETKTNKALEELRVDLVRFLPDLIGKFYKLKDKEESLG